MHVFFFRRNNIKTLGSWRTPVETTYAIDRNVARAGSCGQGQEESGDVQGVWVHGERTTSEWINHGFWPSLEQSKRAQFFDPFETSKLFYYFLTQSMIELIYASNRSIRDGLQRRRHVTMSVTTSLAIGRLARWSVVNHYGTTRIPRYNLFPISVRVVYRYLPLW